MSKRSFKVILTLIFGLMFVFGDGSFLFAQESSTEEFTLEEITVTAKKREQDLQDVSTAIQTISGYDIQEMGLDTLVDVLDYIAPVTIQQAGENLNIMARGMDNDEMPGNSFAAVAVVLDGAYSSNLGVGMGGTFDIERVEVLLGPQGTLYSRNATGGIVNVISRKPTTEKVDASGSIEMGNYSLVNTNGMINVPLSDTLAVRAAFSGTSRDGYITNGSMDRKSKQARLRLGWYPSEDLSVILTYSSQRIEGLGEGWGVNHFEDQDDVDNPWENWLPNKYYRNDAQNMHWNLHLTWNTPIGELNFEPAASKMKRYAYNPERVYDVVAGVRQYVGLAYQFFTPDQSEHSAELRLNSYEGQSLDWIIGLYYYYRDWINITWREDAWIDGVFYEGTDPMGGTTMENPSKAAFGNLGYRITEKVRLEVGGRYTSDKEEIYGVNMFSGLYEHNYYSSSHFDYKLAVEYDLDENSMIWADYSTGYKHVMRNAASQELKAYQIGSNNRFLNESLQLNASAFYYDYSNFAIRAGTKIIIEDSDEVMFEGQGIGDATLYGLDLATKFIITNKDSLDLNVSYLKATTDKVEVTYTEREFGLRTLPVEYIMENQPLNNAPELTITGSYKHRFDLANGGSLTPRFDMRFESEKTLEYLPMGGRVPAGTDVDKVNTQEAHYMADASLMYNSPEGDWSLNGYIKNITNYAEKNSMLRGDMAIGAPRTYGAVLTVYFK